MSMSLKNDLHHYEMFVLLAIRLRTVLLLSRYARQFGIAQIWQESFILKQKEKERKRNRETFSLTIDEIYVDDLVSQNTHEGVSKHFK